MRFKRKVTITLESEHPSRMNQIAYKYFIRKIPAKVNPHDENWVNVTSVME